MAPFNQRQIGYIQAIAGRQQHRTLICSQKNDQLFSAATGLAVYEKPQTLYTNVVQGAGHLSGDAAGTKSLLLHTWHLDSGASLAFDSLAKRNNAQLEWADFNDLQESDLGMGASTKLGVFDAPVKGTYRLGNQTTTTTAVGDHGGHDHVTPNVPNQLSHSGELVRNPELISSIHRATPDGFLNSTNVFFRFTLPGKLHSSVSHTLSGAGNAMGQDHYEFRWIVWRHRKPTLHESADNNENFSNLEAIRDGCSFRNPGYDFFMGQTGRKRGLIGYTLNKDLDKEKLFDVPDGEAYSGKKWSQGGSDWNTTNVTFTDPFPDGEDALTVDDLLTMRINKDDYVVMKDVRFFLGKEHGKSHFEDTLHWDWNDPIDTPKDNVLSSPTLNNKNYRWQCTLIGTNGGVNALRLNTHVRWTTKMESG